MWLVEGGLAAVAGWCGGNWRHNGGAEVGGRGKWLLIQVNDTLSQYSRIVSAAVSLVNICVCTVPYIACETSLHGLLINIKQVHVGVRAEYLIVTNE